VFTPPSARPGSIPSRRCTTNRGLKVERSQGRKVERSQGRKVAGSQGRKVAGSQGRRVARSQDSRDSLPTRSCLRPGAKRRCARSAPRPGAGAGSRTNSPNGDDSFPQAGCAASGSATISRRLGRVYQPTFIDTDTTVGFAKLDSEKAPVTAADLLNDRVLPFFAEHEIPLSRVLNDRGTEYCGQVDRHPDELCLAPEDIDQSRTTKKRPQTNGICERFNKTLLNELYRVVFRKQLYTGTLGLWEDPDADVP